MLSHCKCYFDMLKQVYTGTSQARLHWILTSFRIHGYFLPGLLRLDGCQNLDAARLLQAAGWAWLLVADFRMIIPEWPRKMRNHVHMCPVSWLKRFQPCDGTKLINPSGIHQRSNISLHQSGDVFSSLEDLSLDAEKLEARMYPAQLNTCLLIVEGWMGRQIWVSISFYYF